uniref:Uncharacterized protein n=1 Tax=Oryza punctata TaxID=4537 RepID=A0A0E0LIS8_ORYPU
MAPGSAKDRDGHTTDPVLWRGDYEAAHEKPSAVAAADAAIPAATEGGAAANAPSPPPPPPPPPRVGRIAKSLPHEQPGGRGSGRGAEGSASAFPVGDREGKKTSTATQGGGHASSPPQRLGKKLVRDHPGGGGRGAEGLASAAFPVVDRKGKKKVCAASEGAASASSPPFEILLERLSREELGPGAGGRVTEASISASATAVVDQDEREVREWPRFALVSDLHLLEIGARCRGHKDLNADAQEGTYTVVSSVVHNFSTDFSWWSIMGNPMKQTIPSENLHHVVCIEALHRLEWERLHGPGTFLCRAAAPRKLRRACIRDGILHPEKGIESKKMVLLLKKIKDMGGIRTTNAPPPAPFILPLKSWRMYRQEGSLTRERAVHLLRTGGPYIGIIQVSLLYHFVDASVDDEVVYRWVPPKLKTAADFWLIDTLVAGRATDNDIRGLISETNGNHVVVCYGYRHRGGELQILILDNHAQTGPSRWIRFEELEKVYVLRVDPLPLDLDQLSPLPMYPVSGC